MNSPSLPATVGLHDAPIPLPRLLLASMLIALPFAAMHLLPPLAQDQAYHAFADQRSWFGIPRTLDVLSNLPLLLAGLFGLREALRRPAPPARAPWVAFFGALALVGFGSTWYHLTPSDTSIVWDRLPLAVMFTSLFAAVVGDTISPRLGRRLLLPALAFAAERADGFIFELTGHAFSGHSLKHCLAALACTCVAVMLRTRRLHTIRQHRPVAST